MNRAGRLFTFGCSHTRFAWPTWADILGREFAHCENWGRAGSGNSFILSSIIECHQRNKFTQDDTIMIMWSSTCREDRYVAHNNGWTGQGKIYSPLKNKLYSDDFVKQHACDIGYAIRDMAIITSVIELLEKWNVSYKLFTSWELTSLRETSTKINHPVFDVYANTLSKLSPSLYSVIYGNDYKLSTRNDSIDRIKFYHSNSYKQLAGADWPSFDNYLSGNYSITDRFIKSELTQFIKLLKDTVYDSHCITLEHLEYLDKVFPEFKLSDDTRDWATTRRRMPSLADDEEHNLLNMPVRF